MLRQADWEIRPMREEDLPEIVALEQVCFSDPWSSESFRSEVLGSAAGGYPRVLVAAGRLAAYMIAWFVADEVHLANLAVAPEHRRRGVARALLDDLFREAMARGSRLAALEVRVGNAGAIRLYESYRFKPVAIRKNYYAREQEDALVMFRLLGPEGEKDSVVVS